MSFVRAPEQPDGLGMPRSEAASSPEPAENALQRTSPGARRQYLGESALTSRVISLSPLLLLVLAVGAAGLGQYELSGEGADGAAAACYGLGIVLFLLTPVTARWVAQHQPQRPTASGALALPSVQVIRLPAAAWLLGVGAVLWMVAVATARGDEHGYLSLASWLISLGCLVVGAGWQVRAVDLRDARRRLWEWCGSREGRAVLLLLLVGAAIHLYNLPGVPSGMHGDEGVFGNNAMDVVQGKGSHPFDIFFFGDPALFLYLDAPFLLVLGRTILGLRLLGALAGVVTLPLFYLLLRRLFGTWEAVLGLLLLMGSAVVLHFTRMASNLAEVFPLSILAVLLVWEASRPGPGPRAAQRYWWLLAGLVAGLAVYFNFGGRLMGLVLALYVAGLLLTQPRAWRRWLEGAGFGLLGGALALAPLVAHLWDQQQALTQHVSGRLIFNDWGAVSAVQGTNTLWGVLLGQLRTNLLAFVSGLDASSFYTFANAPVLTPFLAPFLVLGLVFLLVHVRDARFLLLTLWFWSFVIVAGALTLDSPQFHRLAPAVLPAVAGIAVLLTYVIAWGERLLPQQAGRAVAGVALLVPLVAGYQDLSNYFGPAVAAQPFAGSTALGTYTAGLGTGYRVYTLSSPVLYYDSPVRDFLAPDTPGDTLFNPALLPLAVPADRAVAFLVYPYMQQYLPLLQALYPQGQPEAVLGANGSVLFTAYRVPAAAVGAQQGLLAQYGGGSAAARVETDAGQLGSTAEGAGVGTGGPLAARWSGSVYAPVGGRYRLQVQGLSAPAQVQVEGQALGDGGVIELQPGWHDLVVTGTLQAGTERGQLLWQRPDQGTAEVIAAAWLNTQALSGPLAGQLHSGGQTVQREDRALGFRNLAGLEEQAGETTSAEWEGTLQVPEAGTYQVAVNAGGAVEVEIGGQVVVKRDSGGSGSTQGSVVLAAGSEPLRVQVSEGSTEGEVELLWAPPGQQGLTLVPPEAFGPPAPSSSSSSSSTFLSTTSSAASPPAP